MNESCASSGLSQPRVTTNLENVATAMKGVISIQHFLRVCELEYVTLLNFVLRDKEAVGMFLWVLLSGPGFSNILIFQKHVLAKAKKVLEMLSIALKIKSLLV